MSRLRQYRISDTAIDRFLNLSLLISILALVVSFVHSPVPRKTDNPPVAQYSSPSLTVSPLSQRQPFEEVSVIGQSDSNVSANANNQSMSRPPVGSAKVSKPAAASISNSSTVVLPKLTVPEAPKTPVSSPLQQLSNGLGQLVTPLLRITF